MYTTALLADFLWTFHLLADVGQNHLLDAETNVLVQVISVCAPFTKPAALLPSLSPLWQGLLQEFPALKHPCNAQMPVKHDVTLCIEMIGRPVFARARCLAPRAVANS